MSVRKFNSDWEQTTVSFQVASNIRSERVFISRGTTEPNTRKHTENTTEILGNHFEIIEG